MAPTHMLVFLSQNLVPSTENEQLRVAILRLAWSLSSRAPKAGFSVVSHTKNWTAGFVLFWRFLVFHAKTITETRVLAISVLKDFTRQCQQTRTTIPIEKQIRTTNRKPGTLPGEIPREWDRQKHISVLVSSRKYICRHCLVKILGEEFIVNAIS